MLRHLTLFIIAIVLSASNALGQSAPAYEWSGIYVGAHAGGGAARFDFTRGSAAAVGTPGTKLDFDGAMFGPVTGINFQDGVFVYGLEGDASFGDLDGRNRVFTLPSIDIEAIGTVRARAGFAIDNVLVFATAGLGIASVESSERAGLMRDSKIHVGVVTGAGAEYAMNQNLIGRVEVMTGWYGSERHRYGAPVPHSHGIDFGTIIGRASLIWKFGPVTE